MMTHIIMALTRAYLTASEWSKHLSMFAFMTWHGVIRGHVLDHELPECRCGARWNGGRF